MKTLQELHTEIIGSDELKKAYLEAAKGGKIADFLKARGCEASPEEISAFLKEKSNRQLSDEELTSVAGGECNTITAVEAVGSVLTLGTFCAVDGVVSAIFGHTGQKQKDEGRLCTDETFM